MKIKLLKIRLQEEFLAKDQKSVEQFMKNHQVVKFETAFVKDQEHYWSVILYYEEIAMMLNEAKSQKYAAEKDAELSADEIAILDCLKLWRTEKAKEQNLPVYFIASNHELLSIAKYKPLKKEELLDIKGFGKHKIENYGNEIIEILENV